MKPYLILLGVTLLQSCGDRSHKDKNTLLSKWSDDGKTMMVMRKGMMIATIRDSTGACFVELFGPDGKADASVSYYERDSVNRPEERKNIVLIWSRNDGTTKTVAYDSDGNLVEPERAGK